MKNILLIFLLLSTSAASATELFKCETSTANGPVSNGYIVRLSPSADGQAIQAEVRLLMGFLVKDLGPFQITKKSEVRYEAETIGADEFTILLKKSSNGRLFCRLTGTLNNKPVFSLIEFKPGTITDF